MNDMSSGSESSGTRRWRVSAWIIAGIVVLLVVGAAIAAALGGSQGGTVSGPSRTPTSTEGASTPPSSPPEASPGPTIDPDFGRPVADTVPRDQPADFGDRVTARIAAITSVTATGSQPGEVSGPAVQVDVEITNGTSAELSLGTVTVNAYYGADLTPAAPYSQPRSAAFPATLGPGATATARYVFSVPTDAQDSVVITVDKSAGDPIVVFE